MSTAELPETTVTAIKQEVAAIVVQARELVVNDAGSFTLAGTLLQAIKAHQRRVDAAFDDLIAEANRHHKALVARKREYRQPGDDADALIRGKITRYVQEEERRRRERERQLQEEIRRKQEAEAAAARAKAEEERKKRDAEAQRIDAMGLPEIAEQVRAKPLPEPAPIPDNLPPVAMPSNVPKVDGLSFREQWSAEVVDLLELFKAIMRGELPLTLVEPNMTTLNQMARALKGELRIPGVRAVSKTVSNVK